MQFIVILENLPKCLVWHLLWQNPQAMLVCMILDLATELRKCQSNDDVKALGVEWGIAQAKELKAANVPSIHFYSMNAAAGVEAIAKAVY